MRLLNRNKQPIWYSNYVSKTEIIDEYGNSTGSWRITYTAPTETYVNVHATDSEADVEMWGVSAKDTVRIISEKGAFPITSESILWFGKTPTDLTGTQPSDYNYRVVGILPTLNDAVFYAQKVDVS